MRSLSLLLCLLASLTLSAQHNENAQNSWEISTSFSPSLNKRPFLNGVRLETNPDDVPLSQRLNAFDTINIAGQDRIFNRRQSFGFQAEPTSSNFWFGASVTAHRRLGRGFDISAGLFYNQAEYTTGEEDEVLQRGIVNTRSNFLYNLETVQQNAVGLTVRGNYHLFPEARLHPYFGMGVNVYNFQRNRTFRGRAYLGEQVVVLQNTTEPIETANSYVSLDFVATAGLLLRINNNWSAGVDFTSRPVNGPGVVGLQVRRRL